MLQGALLTASVFSLAVPAAAADTDTVRAVTHDQDTAQTAAYWTVSRMASATAEGTKSSGKTPDLPGTKNPTQSHANKVVGAVFYHNGSGDHYCTGSVIHTEGRNAVLTAGHCLYDVHKHRYFSNIAFVPGYNTSRPRPYGTWPVRRMYLDGRWTGHGDPDLDFGFVSVGTVGGRHIENVVGANKFRATQGFHKWVTVIGYPQKKYYHADRPIQCSNWTFKHSTFQQGFDCNGYYDGTSGSPWIINYNPHTQSGYVIGALGGYQAGGATPSRSYSAVFDSDAASLLTKVN
ncbi:trypsin-like peptidase domain-containing protein [Actinoallomurus acanthiterrae]